MKKALNLGIIGMGGFAGSHHHVIRQMEKDGDCRLIGTCDPDASAFRDHMASWEFERRKVGVFDHYLEMLNACRENLDIVTVPTPVPLHAEMHRACVERGIAVYLEKPPTLNYEELEAMMEVESRAVRLTQVGFNFIVEQPRQALKNRLLAGEFGPIRKVCFSGLWPRPASYFTRNSWAGRLMLDGNLVLDSCMGNAMAHYIHNVLFWAGQNGLYSWAEVDRVEAELYRGHRIEGMDTVFARAKTREGILLEIALSHACDGDHRHCEWVICDNATIFYNTHQGYRIERQDGTAETGDIDRRDLLRENFRAYFDYVRGEASRPPTRLADSRPFVAFCDLVYIASGRIATVPAAHLKRSPTSGGSGEYLAIRNLDSVADEFFRTGQFPGEQGPEWAKRGGAASATDLPKLTEVIAGMLG